MDRRSILNCSLVSTHWHGPARVELARLIQDMPFNGLGLVHAIRMRFAEDTFPFLSMTLFDKHVCDLSQLYYHSNPDTKEVFAPAHAPDMLYHLFWTFLFIDQEFRHPKARSKVTCAYFVRLLQNEGGGYPRKYFDKNVLKSIYNDIRSRPLLPAPHLIRALQDVEGLFPNTTGHITPAGRHPTPLTSNGSSTQPTTAHSRQSSFISLASSLRLEESIRRIRHWWGNIRNEGDQNQVGWVSHVDTPVILTAASESGTDGSLPEVRDETRPAESIQLSATSGPSLLPTSSSSSSIAPLSSTISLKASLTTATSSSPLTQTTSTTDTRQRLSRSSTFPQGAAQPLGRTLRMKFANKSDLPLAYSNHDGQKDSNNNQRWAVMNQGYTSVSYGWHAEGDGLDCVVKFPKPSKPSNPVERGQLIRCASVLDMELVV
ncbi:hypothetical protein BG015_011147 [Linnemannia schmuckeri]|uniref:SEC7 domain-containing protein n=1 Tax=Linnemannia schmuckeri TaxID=64567 RepID=A0A9P5RVS7_9FUNG|nr:hypothetical protein BG015_011147 [Linnemannia schmuckeri]